MKRSRFSEEQIIGVLKEAEATTVKGACAINTTSAKRAITTGSANMAGWMWMKRGACERLKMRTGD